MRCFDTFVTKIYFDMLEMNNSIIENFCRSKIQKDFDSAGITQSYFFDVNDSVINPLVSEIETRINQIHLDVGLSSNYQQKIFRGWANLNSPISTTVPHSHPESFFSAVYYVNTSEQSSAIEFVSPVAPLEHVIRREYIETGNTFNNSRWSILPNTGLLIVFPSWIMHYVKGISNDDRISIAFDTIIEKKNG